MDMVSSEKGGAVLSQCVVRLSDRPRPASDVRWPASQTQGAATRRRPGYRRYRPNGTGTGNGINACR